MFRRMLALFKSSEEEMRQPGNVTSEFLIGLPNPWNTAIKICIKRFPMWEDQKDAAEVVLKTDDGIVVIPIGLCRAIVKAFDEGPLADLEYEGT